MQYCTRYITSLKARTFCWLTYFPVPLQHDPSVNRRGSLRSRNLFKKRKHFISAPHDLRFYEFKMKYNFRGYRIVLFWGTGYIHCEIALRVGPSSRRLTHFVAAALPKVPIRALKLGDRTSLAHDIRGFLLGLRCARSTSVAALPVRFRGLVWPGHFPTKRAFFFHSKSAPSSRRLTHFVAAALPKVPIRALKLGDRTSLAHDIRDFPSRLRRVRSTSAAAPPVRFRGLVWPGRFFRV